MNKANQHRDTSCKTDSKVSTERTQEPVVPDAPGAGANGPATPAEGGKGCKPRFRDDMLVLSDEKDVSIFMHPLRQRMLEKMMILAEPVTSKRLADELGIAPSSARHHMLKLESIGVVEKGHQELIHGILATYYRMTDKCISLDVCNTGLWDPTRLLLEENARQVREGALKMMKSWQESPSQDWDDAWGLLETNGVIHLTRQEALELRNLMGDYLHEHSQPRPGTAPIRFDVISYRAGEVKEDDGKH